MSIRSSSPFDGPTVRVCMRRFLASPPRDPGFLLVAPHSDAPAPATPPLRTWRLTGALQADGFRAHVFDPGSAGDEPSAALDDLLHRVRLDVVGVEVRGATLCRDLALAHWIRRFLPRAVIVALGRDATLRPELMFELGPFDLAALGDGTTALRDVGERLREGAALCDIAGAALPTSNGGVRRVDGPAPSAAGAAQVPYERMPFPAYWERLERLHQVDRLPLAEEAREAWRARIRSVGVSTLAESSGPGSPGVDGDAVTRLGAADCLDLVRRLVEAQPGVRTVDFRDDVFVFPEDARIMPLTKAIFEAKRSGELPEALRFTANLPISALSRLRLAALYFAGFRELRIDLESGALDDPGDTWMHPRVEQRLWDALETGMTPRLEIVLATPRSTVDDVAEAVRRAYGWMMAGCDVRIAPCPAAAVGHDDPELKPYTTYMRRRIPWTRISWDEPSRIMPGDLDTLVAVARLRSCYRDHADAIRDVVAHPHPAVDSWLWVLAAARTLADAGALLPSQDRVVEELRIRVPHLPAACRRVLSDSPHTSAGAASPGQAGPILVAARPRGTRPRIDGALAG